MGVPLLATRVLIVDDEAPILKAIAYNLRNEGYTPLTAADAEEAMRVARSSKPDLVILDVMLPSASGIEVCKRLRRESDVPIIMLTAKAEETDRVVGLEIGADDYMTKPFSMRELVARVRALLRRRGWGVTQQEDTSQVGDLFIDRKRHEVKVRGEKVDLSPKEYALLSLLMSYPDQVFSRQTLMDRIWGPDAFVEERSIDVHVRWLREKIETTPAQPSYIQTIRGIGYKLSGQA